MNNFYNKRLRYKRATYDLGSSFCKLAKWKKEIMAKLIVWPIFTSNMAITF